MKNAELLAKIKAEIDRLYGEYKDKFHQCGDQYHLGLIDGLDMAERVLDSLESEHLADARKTLEIKPGDEVTINGHKIVYDKDKGYVTIVKSEESVPNDLEEAAEEYLQKVKAGFLRTLEHPTAKDCFKDGAKWQKQHDAELIEIAYNDGITIGKTKQKEQMMKDFPKWHKVQRGSCFDKHTDFLLSAREGHFYCSSMEVPRDGYILLVNELERLPKEDVE